MLNYSESQEVHKNQITIDNLQLQRIKSAMVFYELEKTLGDFICSKVTSVSEIPSKVLQDIRDRENKSKRSFDETIAKIVAATNLDEILRMAQEISKNCPEEKYLLALRKLFDVLDIFSIRNAICHPNRHFHPSYWYRIAAIATDPSIDKLQFHKVTRAFTDAESNRLFSPPETWINAPTWSLPNNLPEQFDHDLTSLIDRQREIDDLNKLIQNRRLNLIAIVAPGGTGKTALLLHTLQDIVLSPQSTEWVDRILYFSSKTESLTLEGIISQDSTTSSINGICSSISKTFEEQDGSDSMSFEDTCKEYASERILLCLDNLETILRDEPEQFDLFYRDLPREWRVIVTSRVTVNSATIMPLKTLSLRGATALAWNYLSKRGCEKISNDEVVTLVETCDMNPLGIRLTIDGFIAGTKPLIEMQKIAKHKVIDFSYRNLIEALSSTAHELLECLFVESKPVSLTTACSLLKKDLDEISEAFKQVRGTSLVTRIPDRDEECYTLSSSIRDFLIVHPINLDARSAVQEKLRKTKQSISEIVKSQQRLNPLQKEYIPESAPDTIKVVAAEALKIWKRKNSSREELFDALENVRQAVTLQNHSLLHRVLGLISIKLNDMRTGREELQIAFDMSPPDLSSGLTLSLERRKNQELEEAYSIAEKLIKEGWSDPSKSSSYHASLLLQNYYLPLIWLGGTEQVIEDTINWKNKDDNLVCGSLGTFRAMAFRQSVELEKNIESIQYSFCRAIEVLEEVFATNGYAYLQIGEGINLVEQFAKIIKNRRKVGQELNEESRIKLTSFVDKHLLTLTQYHKTYRIDSPEVIQWIQEISSCDIKNGNPLLADRWQRVIENSSLKISPNVVENIEEGWVKVTVKQKPLDKAFLFAQNKFGKKYFIHQNTLELEAQIWNDLQIGDSLEILPDPYPSEEYKYTSAVASRLFE